MPELPEVEHLRQTLLEPLIGASVAAVDLRRADVVRERVRGVPKQHMLLQNARIKSLERHGKHLAIVAEDGRAMEVHLGMSGRLWFEPGNRRRGREAHVHCAWSIRSPRGDGTLIFRDPRRFGGLRCFPSMDLLHASRWAKLGEDALSITARALQAQLGQSRRAVKAALLDQSALAGVGNIYADEALFMSRIHPLIRCDRIIAPQWESLAQSIRGVLARAIALGGSTVRDYVDGNGEVGHFAFEHQVYGRTGELCRRCGQILRRLVISQRSSVHCPRCQMSGSMKKKKRNPSLLIEEGAGAM